MVIRSTITQNSSCPGIAIQSTISREGTGGLPPQQVSLEVAKAGTLSTRTSAIAGTLTLAADHGILSGEIIDVYWVDADGIDRVCYGATVGTVAGVSVPFTGGAGTVLPVQDYVITAGVVVELDADFDADKIEMIVAMNSEVGHIVFEDVSDVELSEAVLNKLEPYQWYSNSGIANPLSIQTLNIVDQLQISNGSIVASTFRFGGVYNSDE